MIFEVREVKFWEIYMYVRTYVLYETKPGCTGSMSTLMCLTLHLTEQSGVACMHVHGDNVSSELETITFKYN